MDVTGTWHGEYQYERKDEGSPATFTLRLTQDALGQVSGTVNDGPGGMPEEGRIIGTCRRGLLRFLKLMPVARVGGGPGSQELTAYLAAAGYEVAGPIEHELLYEGRFGDDGRSATGTWRLDDYRVLLTDGQHMRIEGCRGTWWARRSDA